ncbi:MAG: nickel pincer cofactor biosynthesis protein LarC [Deltaproteobacteria bacterium]|nr:nickel pincer cofactor biosynthesis protein LarC [Deltaproteobacteria bacterium]MBW2388257.1 nickel pincer cofactor biosynthesis protein LarC [Deltaproteobacteria bacterium]MBW2723929.1 nickel pincer cofactor biosynthesis protein LarC [Deltaproteobacteria bacterium]
MFLGALLDLGLSRRDLDRDLAGLGVEYKLRVKNVARGALAARYVEVVVPGAKTGAKKKKKATAKHAHDTSHTHSHGHAHDQAHGQIEHVHPHAHSHGRSYRQVRALLKKAELEAPVRARALAIFDALAVAEGRVHGVAPEAVHFHEVGAVDAIVDITGAAIGLHRLGIERVTASPVALGHGTVQTEHGLLPLPAPATLELLRGLPSVPAHVAWETVTPTGAAILRTIVDEFSPLPAMTVERIGHGAGNDRPGPMPNLLRAVLGEAGEKSHDRIISLECNLDDFNPEHFDYLMERLFEAGALDVSLQNIQMKKNRPGFLVRVLSRPVQRIELTEILMAESTTLGVRSVEWDRVVLPRHSQKVSTPFGRIGIKFVRTNDGRIEVSAEYDDCKRAARKHQASLREVIRAAEKIAEETLE